MLNIENKLEFVKKCYKYAAVDAFNDLPLNQLTLSLILY